PKAIPGTPSNSRGILRIIRRRTVPGRSSGDDDLEALARTRLIVHRVTVHDRERRGFDEPVALAFGYRLPVVAAAGGVEVDAVGTDAFGISGRQRSKRSNARRERRLGRVVRLRRSDARDEV